MSSLDAPPLSFAPFRIFPTAAYSFLVYRLQAFSTKLPQPNSKRQPPILKTDPQPGWAEEERTAVNFVASPSGASCVFLRFAGF